MIDWFIILTPFLVLPIIFRFLFLGCAEGNAVQIPIRLHVPEDLVGFVGSVDFYWEYTIGTSTTRPSEVRATRGMDGQAAVFETIAILPRNATYLHVTCEVYAPNRASILATGTHPSATQLPGPVNFRLQREGNALSVTWR